MTTMFIRNSPPPTNEELVLFSILAPNSREMLDRANALLSSSSDDPMPYALAPLSSQDFTDHQARQIFDLILKSDTHILKLYVAQNMDRSLESFYQRLVVLKEIAEVYFIPFNDRVFAQAVYIVRLVRLRKERPTFEGKDDAKARECAMAIACLQMDWEDLID